MILFSAHQEVKLETMNRKLPNSSTSLYQNTSVICVNVINLKKSFKNLHFLKSSAPKIRTFYPKNPHFLELPSRAGSHPKIYSDRGISCIMDHLRLEILRYANDFSTMISIFRKINSECVSNVKIL